MGLALVLARPGAAHSADPWQATVDRVARSVVAISVSATRPFDTEPAVVALATGFVVDARRGIILTNRHVVQPGPVTAEAVFLDNERVDLQPIYRDPVHDFGFFRYDPKSVHFMKPVALPLAPDAARVGTEIRVIGNDAGEKLSILSGTLARLDRDAPDYGRGSYSDFNTFYYQAASGSSGGSSGSPVVDQRGRALALNAGGRVSAASSFFLPLDRVVRALRLIQAGKPVARGTLQTVFVHRPYDELRRLGLRSQTEAAARRADPKASGMLVVKETVPGGPADGLLQPGDVLLRIDGKAVRNFIGLETWLDGSVGKALRLQVERGGVPEQVSVRVEDLHRITPSSYLEFGGAILHPLSYELARDFSVPVHGLYLAGRGYVFARAGIPPRVVITSLDGRPVGDLAQVESRLAALPQGAELRVRYFQLGNPRSPNVGLVRVDRRWFPMRRCDRDDRAGLWRCQDAPAPPPAPPLAPATTRLEASGPKPVRVLAHSLVTVRFDVPLAIEGVQGRAFTGAGLVVDAKRGLVVVDRDTVPITLGDVRIIFGGAVDVPGRVVALHPEHDLAVVAYDPRLIGDTPVRSAELRTGPFQAGDDLWQVVMDGSGQLVGRSTQVAGTDAVRIPLPLRPRFREKNLEVVRLSESIPGVGGVLADGKGRVRAVWASFSTDAPSQQGAFFAGIPASIVLDMVRPLRQGKPFVWRSLDVEWQPISLATARSFGLPAAAAAQLEEHDPGRPQVLAIGRVARGGPADGQLAVGDLLVDVDGKPANSFREVEKASQSRSVSLTVVRDGALRRVNLAPEVLPGRGPRRVVIWGGAVLQRPPPELALQRGVRRGGVYVAGRFGGTPAQRDGLRATLRIMAVDGKPTPTLDAFLAAVRGIGDRQPVRLQTVDLEGQVSMHPLELDLHYWPTTELLRGPGGWRRVSLPAAPHQASAR